ncbi:hypothetical protein [Rubripirellula reticaptiva]|uniref:Uncharacterized protein n=1 Tax=Rubripirellula reticaptiva TaxID=2528013 RepID=A0A5C6F7B2_9BACT|nr:hypothetical protein [Rubripirellula reticaptiva]TWU56364.1 hypothetical protein Poly59_26680 [Rubripirellula reticaptiva]
MVAFVLATASPSFGFEVDAIIRKIDTDKNVAHVFANVQERTVAIDDDAVKVVDFDGNNLNNGNAAPEPKSVETFTIKVQRESNVMVVVEIRL